MNSTWVRKFMFYKELLISLLLFNKFFLEFLCLFKVKKIPKLAKLYLTQMLLERPECQSLYFTDSSYQLLLLKLWLRNTLGGVLWSFHFLGKCSALSVAPTWQPLASSSYNIELHESIWLCIWLSGIDVIHRFY